MMPEIEILEDSKNDSVVSTSRRRPWVISLITILVIAAGFAWYRDITEPYREAEKMRVLILSLADRRPASLSPKQWESAVAWTNNLHCNSLVWGFTNAPAIRDLRVRMESQLDREVTMDTIIWIWDQYAKLCPLGASYQKWRKVMLDEIDSGGGNWRMVID